MLTEEQRAAIELEESYREAVRRQIRESETQPSRKSLWATLNAPFILFVLSSVVLTGITSLGTWLYATYQEDTAAERAKTKLYADAAYRIAKLDIPSQ